jgi:NADH:ubiquinone oxidoreductase subunit 2 (subunit N)
VIVGVNSVIALFYYMGVVRQMAFAEPTGDLAEAATPPPLGAAIGLTALVTIAIGVYPNVFARLSEIGNLLRV